MVETLTAEIPEDLQNRIHGILKEACERGRNLVTAESCTGGLIASLFTDVDGCSRAFERGYITYTDDAKADMLGVPRDMLDAHGAVSRPVAIAMAEGARTRSNAYCALSVTGFAGPAGDNEEGLVHFGCAVEGRETMHREAHFGSLGRGGVRLACLRTAVEMFEEASQ
ncbi:CinA family protein [uncultured Jannaschia sp.]|uniref:CinA family protein n=1 Tax=uncultured Jannaschia sp. TaxID=293347 RepID=UPI002625E136|nr:CinA family protein [uncultured Jannaschia sp.]